MPSYEISQKSLGIMLGARELLGARHLLAGSAAGLCGSVVKVPTDVVKKRLQAGMYPNVFSAVSTICREGITSVPLSRFSQFYTGWRSAILYDIPYNAIQFTVLENVKRIAKKARGRQLRNLEHVVVGALTGVVTSLATEPVSMVMVVRPCPIGLHQYL